MVLHEVIEALLKSLLDPLKINGFAGNETRTTTVLRNEYNSRRKGS
jgi:hypothetical protein